MTVAARPSVPPRWEDYRPFLATASGIVRVSPKIRRADGPPPPPSDRRALEARISEEVRRGFRTAVVHLGVPDGHDADDGTDGGCGCYCHACAECAERPSYRSRGSDTVVPLDAVVPLYATGVTDATGEVQATLQAAARAVGVVYVSSLVDAHPHMNPGPAVL